MATANTTSSNKTDDETSFEVVGNDPLHERLQDDTGLRRCRGENLETSYEFVKSNSQNISETSTSKNASSTDSTIYHQKMTLSNDESDAISEKVTNSVDSGGAKPKIREKDILMNENSTSDKSEENRLGAEAAETVSENKNDATDDSNTNAAFECNICLDVAREAVISMCGHLFCWPCLHTWLETRPNRQICPVCKAGIGKDKVVPLYGRDDANPKDPRDKPVPPRPKGQRPEPESTGGSTFGGFGGFGGGGNGFQMSFGIGAFPFGFFATNFNLGENHAGHAHAHGMRGHGTGAPEGSAQYAEEQFLHKVFLWVAFLFIFWLLIA